MNSTHRIVLCVLALIAIGAIALGVWVANGWKPGDRLSREQAALARIARITCFSGGTVILDDFAAGDVNINDNGWYRYTSRTTGQRIRTSADCVAVDGAPPAAGFKAVLP